MNIDTILHPPTASTRKRTMEVALVICEAIRQANRIPSGTLYAMLAGKMDLGQYEAFIQAIKNAGLIREEAHGLIWIGPHISDSRPSSPGEGSAGVVSSGK